MQLDSSGSFSTAIEGAFHGGQGRSPRPEVGLCPEVNAHLAPSVTTWCYLFTHNKKVLSLVKVMEKEFTVFVHKTIQYYRDKKRIISTETPSVSGLVFIQGDSYRIRQRLMKFFPSLFLVNNCSTKKVAVIPDSVMQPFMRLSQLEPTRIRFMQHPIQRYAFGNARLRITSGCLVGLEGYLIRLNRDRNLVISVGDMTIAISGVHKESFENVNEYASWRKEEQTLALCSSAAEVEWTPLQDEIDKCFFHPQTHMDLLAMTAGLDKWVKKAENHISGEQYTAAADILLFLLEEMGYYFRHSASEWQKKELVELFTVYQNSHRLLQSIASALHVQPSLAERISVECESLKIRYGNCFEEE